MGSNILPEYKYQNKDLHLVVECPAIDLRENVQQIRNELQYLSQTLKDVFLPEFEEIVKTFPKRI